MARLPTITGAETDNVSVTPDSYRVRIARPGHPAPPGLGTVTALCRAYRTGDTTHAIVRRDGRGVGVCIPMAWLTRLELPTHSATILPFRRPAHVS